MLTYVVRVDYSDGTFDVQNIPAASIAEAVTEAHRLDGAKDVTLCGSIDRPATWIGW